VAVEGFVMASGRLELKNLSVIIEGNEDRPVLEGISLSVEPGEIHAIMGPNGSGKSSLLYSIMGHPKYRVVEGDILLDGESLLDMSPDKRSLRGLFIGFQSPTDIYGIRLSTLVMAALNKRRGSKDLLKIEDAKFLRDMRGLIRDVGLGPEFLRREVNVGFSGGEKKKSEIFQALMMKPKYMLLDEPDTGLDVDSVKKMGSYIKGFSDSGIGILLVTHYVRILNYVRPDRISIMVRGRIVDSGGPELAQLIEEEGYKRYGVVKV
jgi:Fe-S cluster assembly ATP-binding protein